MSRRRVGVLFGGRSGEHEVSLASAYSVMQALDEAGYDVVPIGIDKLGRWRVGGDCWTQLRAEARVQIGPGEETKPLPKLALQSQPAGTEVVRAGDGFVTRPVDWLREVEVVFPVLHGTYGEDGSVQGLLELIGLPYVGAGVAGSAVCMDKGLMKRVLASAGIPQVDWREVLRGEWERDPAAVHDVVAELGYPCFVKPANLGSSVGISKVHGPDELGAALDEAARFDRRLIVEQGLEQVHEIEVAVLGNDRPRASVCGEIVPCHEFYDYEAKYLADGSQAIIPARLPEDVTESIRRYAVEAFAAVDCGGMARIDFFVSRSDHAVYLNELNTIPGFTPISMYPKLWAATGLPYTELVGELVELALARHADRQRSQTSI